MGRNVNIWEGMERYGKVRESIGNYGKNGKVWEIMGRYGKI